MYLGSQNVLVNYNLKLMDKFYDPDIRFSFPFVPEFHRPFSDYALRVMARVHDLNTQLIDMYPVEWHEKAPDYNEHLIISMLHDTEELMTDIMVLILTMLLNLTASNTTTINKLIHQKQHRALNRKPVEGQ
jgi:hypothetical protein